MTEPDQNAPSPTEEPVPSQEIVLKDGSITHDPRLDRIRQFDERSRSFGIAPMLAEQGHTKPRSYSWACDVVLDQGREGACVGFSIAQELRAKPKVVPNVDGSMAMRLYHAAQKIDPWAGGAYPGASPVYHGTSVLAGIKAAQAEGFFPEYRWAFGVADLALAVSYTGPAVLGIDWYSGMYRPLGFRNEVPRKWITRSGSIVGGHAILCVGYNVKINSFLLHNSWGKSWGIDGRAWITYEDMDLLLRAGGEAVIPVKR